MDSGDEKEGKNQWGLFTIDTQQERIVLLYKYTGAVLLTTV